MFPICILGTFVLVIGLAVMEPSALGEKANPFATPLEILPEWYFYPVFQILRTVPNKLLGVLLMTSVPLGLLTVPFIENINKNGCSQIPGLENGRDMCVWHVDPIDPPSLNVESKS